LLEHCANHKFAVQKSAIDGSKDKDVLAVGMFTLARVMGHKGRRHSGVAAKGSGSFGFVDLSW